MKALFAEKVGVKNVLLADLNTTFVTTRIKMDKSYNVAFVIDTASAAVDLTVDAIQSNAATAGTSKALDTKKSYYTKVAAETSFTKVELSVPDASLVLPVFNAAAGTLILEYGANELDSEGGYYWIGLNFADPGAARLINVTAYAVDPKTGSAHSIVL